MLSALWKLCWGLFRAFLMLALMILILCGVIAGIVHVFNVIRKAYRKKHPLKPKAQKPAPRLPVMYVLDPDTNTPRQLTDDEVRAKLQAEWDERKRLEAERFEERERERAERRRKAQEADDFYTDYLLQLHEDEGIPWDQLS